MGADNGITENELLIDIVKRRRTLAADIVDVEEERSRVVFFSVGGKRYAFYGANVREILPAGEMYWIPALPPYLPGLINVRGDIESVIDVGYFLGVSLSDAALAGTIILLITCGDIRCGVRVDDIDDVADIPLCSIEPPLSTLGETADNLVCGLIRREGETVTMLDIEKLCKLIMM